MYPVTSEPPLFVGGMNVAVVSNGKLLGSGIVNVRLGASGVFGVATVTAVPNAPVPIRLIASDLK